MTRHLVSEELVARLDGALSESAERHLAACETCQAALADLETTIGRMSAAASVPEPSPLFWEHLSARVRAETDRVPVRGATIWGRPLTALGAVAALLAVILVSRPSSPNGADSARLVSDADSGRGDEASWSAMAQIASTLSRDDVQLLVAPVPDSAFAVNDLTPKEREAFVRLLGVEMDDVQ